MSYQSFSKEKNCAKIKIIQSTHFYTSDTNTAQVDYNSGTYNSPTPTPDSSPDVQTDHPHTRTRYKMNTSRSFHHDCKHLDHTQYRQHHEVDRCRHELWGISVHGRQKPHKNHKQHRPFLIRLRRQSAWLHSRRISSCIWLCRIVRRLGGAGLIDRSSKMHATFAFAHICRIPCWHCLKIENKFNFLWKFQFWILHGYSAIFFSWFLISFCRSFCFSAFLRCPVFFFGIFDPYWALLLIKIY